MLCVTEFATRFGACVSSLFAGPFGYAGMKLYLKGIFGPAGIGRVLRDEEGQVKLFFSKPIGCVDSTVAEVLAMKEAFLLFAASRWVSSHKLWVESDCKNEVEWCKSLSSSPWKLRRWFNFVESSKSKLIGWCITHTPRQINEVADSLAKLGSNMTNTYLYLVRKLVLLVFFCCNGCLVVALLDFLIGSVDFLLLTLLFLSSDLVVIVLYCSFLSSVMSRCFVLELGSCIVFPLDIYQPLKKVAMWFIGVLKKSCSSIAPKYDVFVWEDRRVMGGLRQGKDRWWHAALSHAEVGYCRGRKGEQKDMATRSHIGGCG
ncbi:hypothetical protein REPUB_Repub12eG0092500 [Reevesia pubescens]